MMWPHERYAPTMPGSGNTGERYIFLNTTAGADRQQVQYVMTFGGGRLPRPARAATDDGYLAIRAMRDAAVAGVEVERIAPAVRELLEPETYAERVRVATERDSRNASFRRRVLTRYGTSCTCLGCGYSLHVEAAHLVSVANGGTDATDNGRPLCRNHHWEFDNGLLNIGGVRRPSKEVSA